MAALQDHYKNLLHASFEFRTTLSGAVELSRDADEWEKLIKITGEIDEALTQARYDIQKRYPPYRDRYKGPSQVTTGSVLSAGGSSGSHVSSHSGNVHPPVPFSGVQPAVPFSGSHPSMPFASGHPPAPFASGHPSMPYAGGFTGKERGDVAQELHNNRLRVAKPDLLNDAERTRKERAQFNKSPTKMNNRAKKDWLDTDGPRVPNPFGAFLHGLSVDTKENDVRTVFAAYGKIRQVIVFRDKKGGDMNIGKVYFESKDDAQSLIKKTFMVGPKQITVAPLYEKPRPEKSENRGPITTTSSGQQSSRTVETFRETITARRVPSEKGSIAPSETDGKCMLDCGRKVDCMLLGCGHRIVCFSCGEKLSVCPVAGCGKKVDRVNKMKP